VYPSPDQTNVEDGPICIKIRIAPQELWLNAKEAKGASAEKDGVWFTDTVSDLLAKYPTGGVRLSWQDGDEQNRMLRGQSCWMADASCMMERISYYGQLKGNLLLRMGVTKSRDGTKIDPGDYYEVNAIVIDDYCVYCRIITPCMGRPLCKAQFYDSPDNFFGNSIAQRLIAYQRFLNACLPALVFCKQVQAVALCYIGRGIIWCGHFVDLLYKMVSAGVRVAHLRFYFVYWWNCEKTDKQQDGAKSKNRMVSQRICCGMHLTVAFSVHLRLQGIFSPKSLLTVNEQMFYNCCTETIQREVRECIQL
jgi:hypothetical protein